jgi:hypothetical protein
MAIQTEVPFQPLLAAAGAATLRLTAHKTAEKQRKNSGDFAVLSLARASPAQDFCRFSPIFFEKNSENSENSEPPPRAESVALLPQVPAASALLSVLLCGFDTAKRRSHSAQNSGSFRFFENHSR